MYLKTELQTFDMKELNSKFDVILVEPPLEEYQRTMGVTNMQFWGWDQVRTMSWNEVVIYVYCVNTKGDLQCTAVC
jgi:mRNA (2'-O-methyladenosine-N6-)-methyltransferase